MPSSPLAFLLVFAYGRIYDVSVSDTLFASVSLACLAQVDTVLKMLIPLAGACSARARRKLLGLLRRNRIFLASGGRGSSCIYSDGCPRP